MKVFCAGAESRGYQWALLQVTALSLQSFIYWREHPDLTSNERDLQPPKTPDEDISSAGR